MKVLSVTDSGGMNVDNAREPVEDEEKQQSATITVLATPEQARVITALENDGIAHVALVSRGNEELADELLAEQECTLQEIYFPETLLPEEESENGTGNTDAEDTGDSGTTDDAEGAGDSDTADGSEPGSADKTGSTSDVPTEDNAAPEPDQKR